MKIEVKPAVCAHCQQSAQGYATVGGDRVCHVDNMMDCYRLVTLYRHPLPCPDCITSIARTYACSCQSGTEHNDWQEVQCYRCRAMDIR